MELEVRGVRHLGHDEAYALLHDPGNETDFPGKSVQLGYDDPRRVLLGKGDCLPELRSIIALAGLDLNELSDQSVIS